MGSWDRFQIPLPFGRVDAIYGDPLFLDPEEGIEAQRKRVETRMNQLTHETGNRAREARSRAWLFAVYRLGRSLFSLVRLPGIFRTGSVRWRRLNPLPGTAPPPGGAAVPGGPDGSGVWVHAPSAEAVPAAALLVEKIREHDPHSPLAVSVSTNNEQGLDSKTFGEGVPLFSFHPERPFAVSSLLRAIRPRLFVQTEDGIRPDLCVLFARKGIPSALVNGRISLTAGRRKRFLRFFYRHVLDNVSVFGMQTREDAYRIIRLGADPRRVVVTGKIQSRDPTNGNRHTEAADRSAALLRPWLEDD